MLLEQSELLHQVVQIVWLVEDGSVCGIEGREHELIIEQHQVRRSLGVPNASGGGPRLSSNLLPQSSCGHAVLLLVSRLVEHQQLTADENVVQRIGLRIISVDGAIGLYQLVDGILHVVEVGRFPGCAPNRSLAAEHNTQLESPHCSRALRAEPAIRPTLDCLVRYTNGQWPLCLCLRL